MKNMFELSEGQFEAEVLKSAVPVLVDFYAPWCGPCKMLTPMLEQLAAEFQGRLKFTKVNVDAAPGLAERYQITGVPTLMVFREGRQVDALVGLLSPKAMRGWLEKLAADVKETSAAAG